MSPLRQEIRRLTALSLPVMAAQLGTMTMGVVDTLMVGRVGVDALAAAGMANAWIYGILLLGQGFVHGVDPIITRCHGARDGEGVALAFQRSLVLVAGLSVALGGLLYATEDFLLWVGQDPALALQAHEYAVVQVGSVPFFLGYVALRLYLQGRGIMRPAMWVVLFANFFNAGANWALIFGKLGAPALGLYGAGIATSLSRVVVLVGLLALVRGLSLHRGAWVPFSGRVLAPGPLRQICAFGVPVAIQMSLEVWAFSAGTLLAGRLGPVPVAAHNIVFNMAALSFMLPLGISQGAVTRVGNLLGERDLLGAKRAAWVAVAMGAGVMTLSALLFVTLRHFLPALYTPAPAVIAAAAAVLPIAALFQVFDGTQVVGCGVLRGMGRTRPAAIFNFIGYWVLGLPLAAWLSESRGWGLAGVWWGLAVGLAVVAVSIVVWLRFRGPERAAYGVA